MAVVISDETVRATGLSEQQLRIELAVGLYRGGTLTTRQCADFAQLERIEFERLLSDRGIPANYDLAAYESDLRTLAELERR